MKKEKLLKLEMLKKKYKNCKKCPLCDIRNKIVFGRGAFKKRIAILGEAPGPTEDETGDPFTGKSGKEVLDRLLRIAKLNRNDCFIFNSVLCFPGRNPEGGFMKPTESQIAKCKPRLKKVLKILKPKVIVAMGNIALYALTGETGIAENRQKAQV